MKTTIHVIRHGDVHNPNHIFYGRMPRYRLSTLGQQQAQAAAAYLADRPLRAIYASPRLRARQTAQAVAMPHDLRVRRSSLLDEILSAHQGRPTAELDAEGWLLYHDVPPGYETADAVQGRMLRLLQRLRKQHAGEEIAVVTHGDVVLATRFWVEGIPFCDDTKNRTRLYPATASVTTLVYNGAEKPQMTYHQPY